MKILSQIRNALMLLAAISMFASCAKEDFSGDRNGDGYGDGDTDVTIVVKVPGNAVPTSRSLGKQQEDEVTDVMVMAFMPIDNTLKYIAASQGEPTIEDGKLKFTVTLPVGRYDIAVLANAQDIVERVKTENGGNIIGMGLGTLQKSLTMTVQGSGGNADNGEYDKWNVTVDTDKKYLIPMWGMKNGVEIVEESNQIDQVIRLYRMLAKVDVKVQREADKNWPGVPKSDFVMKYVSFHNYSRSGRLMPDAANGNWTEPTGRASLPSLLPGDKQNLVTGHEHCQVWLDDEDDYAKMNMSLEGIIYTFEADKGTNYTNKPCVIVGGYYGWDGTGQAPDMCYYRIDMIDKAGKPLNLLRNHKYTVTVHKVKGPGFETPEIAYKSKPINIEAEITEWDDGNMGEIVFDGQNILTVSQGWFGLPRDAREEGVDYDDNNLRIFTDYETDAADGRSGWYVESITDFDDEDVDWLRLSEDEGDANRYASLKLLVDENDTQEIRVANITIAAGRLRYKIIVTQFEVPDINLKILGEGNDMEISELHFRATGGFGIFGVKWLPTDVVAFVSEVQVGDAPFPSLEQIPVSQGYIGPEKNNVFYQINPSDIDPEDLEDNPFFERASTLTFTVSNGVSTMAKSIVLRQFNYDLLTDAKPFYMLTGSEYTINVRTNAQWVVDKVVDDDGILVDKEKIMKQKGGYNTNEGDPLKFKVIPPTDDFSKSGKIAYIHLKDPYYRGERYEEVIIPIVGMECGANGIGVPMKLLGSNGDYNGWDNSEEYGAGNENTYLTHVYPDNQGNMKCWMVQNSREARDNNVADYGATYRNFGDGNTYGFNPDNNHPFKKTYYYSYHQTRSVSVCPQGWHVPTTDEAEGLRESYLDAVANNKLVNFKWWAGSEVDTSLDKYPTGNPDGAYSGLYSQGSGVNAFCEWNYLGSWYYGGSEEQLHERLILSGDSRGITLKDTQYTESKYTVRCVKD